MEPINITRDNIESYIAVESSVNNKPILFYFTAPWCGPCKKFALELPTLIEEYKDTILFGKINVDDESELAKQYGVRSVPSFIVYNVGGEIVDRWTGVLSAIDIRKRLDLIVSA